MRAIKVLSVCGSGTVSSAMLSSKLEDVFAEKGYDMEATEVSPGGVPGAMQSGGYDMIVYTNSECDRFFGRNQRRRVYRRTDAGRGETTVVGKGKFLEREYERGKVVLCGMY